MAKINIDMGKMSKNMSGKIGGFKMKKVLLSLALGLVVVFSMSTAQAGILDGWTFDLSGIDADFGNHINIDRFTAAGDATVTQDFGGDGVFGVGDTFSESATFVINSDYFEEPGAAINQVTMDLSDNDGSQGGSDNNYHMLFSAVGLTGTIATHSDGGTPADVTDDTFTYTFNPGVGMLSLTLVDSLTAPTVSYSLATWALVPPSGGDGPNGFLGGTGPNGTTDLTMMFTSAYAGVWQTAGGMDFSTLPFGTVAFGLYNGNNVSTGLSQIPNGFVSTVTSSGEFKPAIIPEPTSMLLLGGGLLGLFGARRKRKNV
jgi:PEP-CTERM motif